MPTLRLELMKSRDDDEEKDFIVEKRVVHSSRVKVAAGYSQHAFKLKKCNPTEVKQVNERLTMGKALGITKKLGMVDVHGSLRTSFKALPPQSPSESDSFSIASSSSSCKSEADSIKKPSPPSALAKPSTGSLHINLGSYFGAMWDANHVPPCDFSEAIHENLEEERTMQNGFLEFRFSEGKMQESRPLKGDEGKSTNYAYAKGSKGGCALKHDYLNPEVAGMATPTSYSASARSHETCSETSFPSGDTCSHPSLGDDLKQTPSIKQLMAESRDSPHKEGGVLSVEEPKQCQSKTEVHVCEGENATCISHVTKEGDSPRPFEADVGIDRVHARRGEINSDRTQIEKRLTCPRTLSCHLSHGKQEEGFSFQVSPCEGIRMRKATSCRHTSVEQSSHPGVVSVEGKRPAKVHLEKYVYRTQLVVGNNAPSTQSHGGERGNNTQYLPSHGSSMHDHEASRKFTTSDTSAMTPPSVQEIKCKANFDELTPLSPLSLSEASSNLDIYVDECRRDYFDMAWFAASSFQPPLTHPSKAHWDWRSKSIGARASLKSAVRNLEAAFGGSRSVSLPKMRSQTSERERKSETSKFIDRVFASPVKNHHRRSDTVKQAVQRLSYSGAQGPEDSTRNGMLKRREAHSIGNGRESTGSNYHHFVRPSLPPLNKHHQRSDMPDLKVLTIPFLPISRSVHCLAPLKELSGHTNPLISTPPSSALRRPTLPLPSMLQGYLQCFERDGKTCYTLSLKDSDEMLLAKACTFGHNSSQEGCKWMYTFQSGRSKSRGKGANGWKSWLKKDSKFTTDLAGKMQVSSELSFEMSPTGKRMQFLVSEFVLYDERNDDTTRSQSLRFLSSADRCRSTCTPAESPLSARSAHEFAQSAALARKQVPNIPRSPSSARMSSKWGASSNNQQQSQPYSPLKRRPPAHYPSYSIDVWSDSDVAEPEVRPEGLYSISHSELAAIVIKMPSNEDDGNDHQFSNSACRRSLKFCDDQSKGPCQDRSKTSDAATLCGSKQGLSPPASGCVTMMLPKEHHGLPKDRLHGPTTLINRWKCGGKCDCGGWDLGCGMKIFSSQRCETLAATSDIGNSIQSISHKQPLVLYSQGKSQNVLLSLCLVQEGYFILKFQNEVSPLRAFATSVAILHSRESSSSKGRWMPIVKTNKQCQSDPDTVGRSNDKPAFLEVCDDIPTWCPSNSPAPSPYGRA